MMMGIVFTLCILLRIMKTIVDDPEGFFESGGWSFLDPESDGEATVGAEACLPLGGDDGDDRIYDTGFSYPRS